MAPFQKQQNFLTLYMYILYVCGQAYLLCEQVNK